MIFPKWRNYWGLLSLWVSSFSIRSLTQSSLTKGSSSFLQTFSLASRVWDSWGLALAVKTEAKKPFSNSTFSYLLSPGHQRVIYEFSTVLSKSMPGLTCAKGQKELNSEWKEGCFFQQKCEDSGGNVVKKRLWGIIKSHACRSRALIK